MCTMHWALRVGRETELPDLDVSDPRGLHSVQTTARTVYSVQIDVLRVWQRHDALCDTRRRICRAWAVVAKSWWAPPQAIVRKHASSWDQRPWGTLR